MSIDTVSSAFVLGFTPLASEHWGLLAFLVILAGGGVWFFLDKKLKALAQQSAAIEQVRPYAVDVSGGVEAGKGIKDAAKLRAFMQAVGRV